MKPKKKIPRKFQRIASVRDIEWVTIGIDLSLATVSVGALCKLKSGKLRSGAFSVRWSKEHDYYDRLKLVAKPYENVFYPLFEQMGIQPTPSACFIVYEEAVPLGMLRGKAAQFVGNSVKQQIQISGSLVGGLLTEGYPNIYEIPANKWRALVAHDLGITIHTSKWNDPTLANEFHCAPKSVGKFRAKQWVAQLHPKWDGGWTDIISHAKLGMIPRPITSKARGLQSDDRYEALAMAEFMRRELKG